MMSMERRLSDPFAGQVGSTLTRGPIRCSLRGHETSFGGLTNQPQRTDGPNVPYIPRRSVRGRQGIQRYRPNEPVNPISDSERAPHSAENNSVPTTANTLSRRNSSQILNYGNESVKSRTPTWGQNQHHQQVIADRSCRLSDLQ